MAPGALQQRQMISSPSIKPPQLSFTFNTNDSRAPVLCGDAPSSITHQVTQTDSPVVVIKTHAEIRTDNYLLNINFDDLNRIRDTMHPRDVENAVNKYLLFVENAVNKYLLFVENAVKGLVAGKFTDVQGPTMINKLFNLMCLASSVCELNNLLRNRFRDCGGIDLLIENCLSKDPKLQYSSARLLVECIDSGNLDYVVQHGLTKIMHVVHAFQEKRTANQSKVSTGLLAKLFEHSEGTCMRVIQLHGLDVLLAECKSRDTTTLRNCARALANLSMYGGTEVHNQMVHDHAHIWLFTLAFNQDDSVKYYALLAAAVLAADRTIEAAMANCETLDLIDPFVATHVPADLVGMDALADQVLGQEQRQRRLQCLVPVLSCDRHEAHALAAFHFCAESDPSSQFRHGEIARTFRTIGAVESLKKLAGSIDDVTSGLAAQALRNIGERVPRPLSQKVPLWTVEDVVQWTKSTGFGEWAERLVDDHIGLVDGEWLLMLTEECLKERFGIPNGIERKRFMRELHKLKQLADYSCIDSTNLKFFLQSIGLEYSVYTYNMLNAGFDCDSMRFLTDDQLAYKCGITNGIHRNVILNSIKCCPFNSKIKNCY